MIARVSAHPLTLPTNNWEYGDNAINIELSADHLDIHIRIIEFLVLWWFFADKVITKSVGNFTFTSEDAETRR